MSEPMFIENLMKNLEKNGYPKQKVSFPLERLYESAYQKGLNFNKILEALRQNGVDHEKTSTKIIFFPKSPQESFDDNLGATLSDFLGQNSDINGNLSEMMAQAQQMLKSMSPEQHAEISKMVATMSPQERGGLMSKAKEFSRARMNEVD